METKHKWKSNEPWKKHEPGARVSKKQKDTENRHKHQRSVMEKKSTQNVTVYPESNPLVDWLPKGYYKQFSVKLSIMVTEEEFLERMGNAFPELELKKRKTEGS